MKTLKIVVFVLTAVHVICGEDDKQSTYGNLQKFSLNQGEYIPTDEQKGYDSQYGYKQDYSNYYIPQSQNTKFMVIKRTKPITKKLMISRRSYPASLSYAAVHQTKIMPVNIIQEGPVRHVYLPSHQPKTFRTARAHGYFNKYPHNSAAQYQELERPSLKYANTYFQPNFGINHGFMKDNILTSEYGYGKPLIPSYNPYNIRNSFPNGHESSVYSSHTQYIPQSFTSPELSPNFKNEFVNQQYSQVAGDIKYSENILNHYKPTFNGLDNKYNVQPVNNIQSSNSGSEANFTNLASSDPELASIVNDVINKGKGIPTHDGFTMIKSKTDNAIYLIGKPGMSLSTLPNFSAYNYNSFKNSEKTNENKIKE